ncbi:MAG: ACP S-malonyltransferase [Oscillospiraceae bacterium]|nr:ACP S-malonyltransferase [Oscillospiraceae bacterium]
MKKAFLFPGQGSQYAGMALDCAKGAKEIFDKAGKIADIDLWQICADQEDTRINETRYCQISVFAASMAYFYHATENGTLPDAVAGHSLGEYAAMTAAGIISFEDACSIVNKRGIIMADHIAAGDDGVMCAIIGASSENVREVCSSVSGSGIVMPVNYNSPVQTVIAGEKQAVLAAAEKFKSMRYKAVMLAVSGAFHTPMMQGAADAFYEVCKNIKFTNPKTDFYSNLTGRKMTDFSNMPKYLSDHMVSPVLFADQIRAMQADGYDDFCEIGTSKILSGMVKKIIK